MTIKSARGLEAENVIVIGLSEIKDSVEDRSLANIALTRANKQTYVVMDRAGLEAPVSHGVNAVKYLRGIQQSNVGFVENAPTS